MRRVNEFLEQVFDVVEDMEYEFETIKDSAVYNKDIEDQFPGLYYLVS